MRLMPLGDSLTYESAPPTGSVWRARLWDRLTAAGLAVEMVGSQRIGSCPQPSNEGHPGYRTDQIAAGVDGWLLRNPANLILLLIGTNDALQTMPGAAGRIGSLLDRIALRQPEAAVLVSTLPPISALYSAAQAALVAETNAELPAAIAQRRTAVSRWHLVDAGGSLAVGDLSADGVHPSPDGYRKLGDAWASAILEEPTVNIFNVAPADVTALASIPAETDDWEPTGNYVITVPGGQTWWITHTSHLLGSKARATEVNLRMIVSIPVGGGFHESPVLDLNATGGRFVSQDLRIPLQGPCSTRVIGRNMLATPVEASLSLRVEVPV